MRECPLTLGGPSLQDTASTSELVLPPWQAPLILQLAPPQPPSRSLPGPSTVWSSRCHGPFPLFCPHHSLNPVPASLGCTQAFQLHQQKFPFLPHFFRAKARLSYHQNHSQMTGFNGLTRNVSNYLLGAKSETAWLKWKRTFAQVRAAPTGCSRVYGPCPATHAVCSQEPRPSPICPLALGPAESTPNRQVVSPQRWSA